MSKLCKITDDVSTVTAFISTHNGERFFAGCVEDLLAQTLYAQGRLEIVVVNAGSKQGEAWLIRDYLAQGVPLKVITSLREPLYSSWNRALRLATGDYVSNSNVDDRRAPDALERLADALDASPDIGLVYADDYVTDTPNATWGGKFNIVRAAPYPGGVTGWAQFTPRVLLERCICGPHPMWRRSLHEEYGYFDESFTIAGDYEMWLRLAAHGVCFQKIGDVLGIYYCAEGALSLDQEQTAMESRRALYRWRGRIERLGI